MWKTLIKIQKILQRLRPLKIIFSEEQGGFTENLVAQKNISLHLIDTNLMLITIASGVGLRNILNLGDTTVDPGARQLQTQKFVLGSVIFFLFLSLFMALLTAVWTFRKKSHSAVSMMQQSMSLYLERQRSGSNIVTKKEAASFGLLLYSLLIICFVGLFAVTVVPAGSRNTPAHVISSWIFGNDIVQERPLWITLLCCSYIGVSGYFGVIPVIQTFCFITAVLYELKFILQRGYGRSSMMSVTMIKEWIIYCETEVLVRNVNAFGFYYFPALMVNRLVNN